MFIFFRSLLFSTPNKNEKTLAQSLQQDTSHKNPLKEPSSPTNSSKSLRTAKKFFRSRVLVETDFEASKAVFLKAF